MKQLLLTLVVFFIAHRGAIGQSCCEPYLNAGTQQYNQKHYKRALDSFLLGEKCYKYFNDEPECQELRQMINETRKRLKAPKIVIPEEVPQILPIQDNLDDLQWNRVKFSFDPNLIQTEYLDRCINSKCKYEAQALAIIDSLKKVDENKWYAVSESKDPEFIQTYYLDNCTKPCKFKSRAEARMKELKALQAADKKLWTKVEKSEDLYDIQKTYLDGCKQYGCGYKKEALGRIQAIIASLKPKQSPVRGGNFTMGNTIDRKPPKDQSPYKASIKDFNIGVKEITFREYDAFCFDTKQEKPSDEGWGRGNYPAINISWFDAVRFCNWRSQKDGFNLAYTFKEDGEVQMNAAANGYRLPTETEWEFAAREGGKAIKYGNGSNEITFQLFNYAAPLIERLNNPRELKPIPSGSLPNSNRLGIFDMSGNVLEWCWDWYDQEGYKNFEKKLATNSLGPINSTGQKTLRGGGCNSEMDKCTVYYREHFDPEFKNKYIGFRVARNN